MEIYLPKGIDPTEKKGVFVTEDGKRWKLSQSKQEEMCAMWDGVPMIQCTIGVKKNVRTVNHNVVLLPEDYKA